MQRDTKYWARAAVTAAVYAALTLMLTPFSYGIMQVRAAEVLVVLCVYAEWAVPGITAGCLIANLLGPNGMIDVVFGTLASLIGAWGTYRLRGLGYAAPLANVAANALIVGAELYYIFGLNMEYSLAGCMLWVGAGELISCTVLGVPLMKFLSRRRDLTL